MLFFLFIKEKTLISEGQCDTEDWSDDAENAASQEQITF